MSELATIEGVDTFNRMLGDLANIGGPGTNLDAVVRGEVGHLLETCIRYTPTARAEVIDQRVLYKERTLYSAYSGGLTGKEARAQSAFISVGQRDPSKSWYVTPNTTGLHGQVWRETTRTEDGQIVKTGRRHSRHFDRAGNVASAWHEMSRADRHWPDWIWAAYQREEADRRQDYEAHLAAEKRAGRASRGLSAQSWLEIADALGIDIRIAQYVRRAVPSDGKTYTNGAGRREVQGDATTYILENFQPILLHHDGQGIVERALAARLKAFDTAVEKGLATDLLLQARNYPALLAA